MKYILNNISHFDFFQRLEKKFSEIVQQLEDQESDEIKFKQRADRLIEDTEIFLKSYIVPEPVDIIMLFDKSYNDHWDRVYSSYGFDKEPEITAEIERLDRFAKSLRLIIGYLSMTQSLLNPEEGLVVTSISEKNDFLLAQLNSVFGDEMYSIELIFKLNGIKYRDGETREIGEDLNSRAYLILRDKYLGNDKAKISVKGARYIERKHKMEKKSKEKNELDKKIDVILEKLSLLGYGQEIIFNEINELRGLQHTLSKKSWAQLLKGKLVDLAFDELISVDLAKTVYEYLTSNNFRLLK